MRYLQFPIRKGGIFSYGKEIECLRGGVHGYAAQGSPKIDTARAGKHPFRTETNSFFIPAPAIYKNNRRRIRSMSPSDRRPEETIAAHYEQAVQWRRQLHRNPQPAWPGSRYQTCGHGAQRREFPRTDRAGNLSRAETPFDCPGNTGDRLQRIRRRDRDDGACSEQGGQGAVRPLWHPCRRRLSQHDIRCR